MSIGEYETPGLSLTQWSARAFFLTLLPKLAPKAVKELSGKLLRSLQSAERDGAPFLIVLNDIINCSERGVGLTNLYSPEQVNFYQQLTDWADKYNLNSRWLIEHVVQLLDWWKQFPKEAGKNMTSGLGHSEEWFAESEPFRFEYAEWRYHELSEHEYRQAIGQAFTKELKLYLKHRSSQALASGEQRVKHTRKRGEIDSTIRVKWFVHYQVNGLTTKQILDLYAPKLPESATHKQVNDAVRDMAALIGLPRRRVRRGAPKKQR